MQKIGATGDGKSTLATPDGKKPKEEEEETAPFQTRKIVIDPVISW